MRLLTRTSFSSSGRPIAAIAALGLTFALIATACGSSAPSPATDAASVPESTTEPKRADDAASTAETNAGNGESSADQDGAVENAADTDDWCPVPTTEDGQTLNSAGAQMFSQRISAGDGYPTYRLSADIDPATGTVNARMRATVPDRSPQLQFRAFAGVPSFDANLAVDEVRVNGTSATAKLDQSLLTIENPNLNGPADTLIEMDFSYVLQETAASSNLLEGLTGESLEPAKVGLLGRTSGGAQLGHWFPVWLPPVSRSDATLDGFGDIGAFPAAGICVALRAPSDYQLISGGVATNEPVLGSDGWTTHTEGALGLRDLALLFTNELSRTSAEVDGVAVNVWGPSDDADASAVVLDYAVTSQAALADAFGPYPWTELDVVSAPLGSGVGGMEWPGMVWIESAMFAGGIPGLGGLTDSDPSSDTGVDSSAIDDLLESGLFDDLLGGLPGGEALETSLEWTVAHELGHEWWHAVVGNDSVESPAVDEPLAQFAACVAMRKIHPENWRDVCESQTLDTYAQMRGLAGMADAPAEQPSDAFDSSLQYGAIVYGKAPGFYFEAADLLGWDQLEDALKSFVAAHPFELVETEVLRSHLIEAAGDNGPDIADLWDRWFRGMFGDEDIGVADTTFGLPGGADLGELLGDGGIEDLLSDGGLEDLLGDGGLEDLLGDGGLEELLGDGGLEDLLGDGGLEGLLEDLLGEGGLGS